MELDLATKACIEAFTASMVAAEKCLHLEIESGNIIIGDKRYNSYRDRIDGIRKKILMYKKEIPEPDVVKDRDEFGIKIRKVSQKN